MMGLFVIPGHGAGDPGAGAYGYNEAERVRALATAMKNLGGDQVVLADFSRNYYADGGVSSMRADLPVIELHMDSASALARGGHVIIHSAYSPNDYDRKLQSFIGSMFPGRSETLVQRSNLANLNRAKARRIDYRFLECCFITNYDDLSRFNNEMNALARGILTSFGIGVAQVAGWVRDEIGWWYRNTDGTYPRNGFAQINGDWYYFNDGGYAVTGWNYIGGYWYYFNRQGEGTECAMAYSCVRWIWGLYYAFDVYGHMITGAVPVNENGALIL